MRARAPFFMLRYSADLFLSRACRRRPSARAFCPGAAWLCRRSAASAAQSRACRWLAAGSLPRARLPVCAKQPCAQRRSALHGIPGVRPPMGACRSVCTLGYWRLARQHNAVLRLADKCTACLSRQLVCLVCGCGVTTTAAAWHVDTARSALPVACNPAIPLVVLSTRHHFRRLTAACLPGCPCVNRRTNTVTCQSGPPAMGAICRQLAQMGGARRFMQHRWAAAQQQAPARVRGPRVLWAWGLYM